MVRDVRGYVVNHAAQWRALEPRPYSLPLKFPMKYPSARSVSIVLFYSLYELENLAPCYSETLQPT